MFADLLAIYSELKSKLLIFLGLSAPINFQNVKFLTRNPLNPVAAPTAAQLNLRLQARQKIQILHDLTSENLKISHQTLGLQNRGRNDISFQF